MAAGPPWRGCSSRWWRAASKRMAAWLCPRPYNHISKLIGLPLDSLGMKILLASSEVHPYSKTGGLADMVGALAKTLARLGHDVALVTPLYAGIASIIPDLQRLDYQLDLPLGPGIAKGSVFALQPAER